MALEHVLELHFHLFDEVGVGRALGEQLGVVDFARIRMARNRLVQQRLGEAGLVALVVAVLAVAEQVNKYVASEVLAVFHREAHGVHHRFYVVAVHVQYRSQYHLGHVGRIGRGTRVEVVGGESDLVVDDEVNGSTSAVAVEALHLHDFVDNALAGHCGVTVDVNRKHLRSVHSVVGVALSAGDALNHRVHGLEVRGVGRNVEFEFAAIAELARRCVPQVVLYVAVKALFVVKLLALKFAKDLAGGLAKNIGEHIEATAVGHAEHDLLDAEFRGALHHKVKAGNQRFSSLNREALLADKLGVQKVFKRNGLVELVKDVLLFVCAQDRIVVVRVNEVLNPLNNLRVADVHVLDANRTAVNGLEVVDDLAKRSGARQSNFYRGLKAAVKVCSREAKILEVQRGLVGTALTDRVGLGKEVPAGAVSVDEVEHHELFAELLGNFGAHRRDH